MNIDKKIILIIIPVVIISFIIGYGIRGSRDNSPRELHEDHGHMSKIEEWTCSMHPNIRSPEQSDCPICGMDLIPVTSEDSGSKNPREIKLSPNAIKLAEIQTTPIERRKVSGEIHLVGKIDYDETRLGYITSWVDGRIDKLYVDYTGTTVKKGDPLVYIYSPELLALQQEFLQAKSIVEESSGMEIFEKTLAASRKKLELFGLSHDQINEIEQRGTADDHINVLAHLSGTVIHKNAVEGLYVKTGDKIYTIADLSKVWVKMDAYESDIANLKEGQQVKLGTEAYPGEIFRGKIEFIDPVLDAKTRTINVRASVPNPSHKLKPEMLVSATVSALSGTNLVIPASAPLITGKRAVVYVQVPEKEGVFQGREIVLGQRHSDYYVVKSGLSEGELVVTNGNFKIDSAIQILAKPSMMNPEDGHHVMEVIESSPKEDHQMEEHEEIEKAVVPDKFKSQLDGVYSAYFEVQQALSHDKFEDGQTSAQKLKTALNEVDMGLLVGQVHMNWMKILRKLEDSAKGIEKSVDMEKARAEFEKLTFAIDEVLKIFGSSENQPILRFHCPMAFGNKGADWFQNKTGVENPYFGSMMFKCGEQTEVVEPGK